MSKHGGAKKIIRRTKTPAVIQPPQPNAVVDPITRMENERRQLYTKSLDAMKDLPAGAPMPESVRANILAHARKQTSENDLILLADCSVDELRQLLIFLLQPPHLRAIHIGAIIRSFLTALRIQQGVQTDPLDEEVLERNHRIYRRIQKYVQEHLSIFLPHPPTPATDVASLELLREGLYDAMIPIIGANELLEPLFSADIPVESIKIFLVTDSFQLPTGEYNIRWAVQRFIREHQFDLIHDALQRHPQIDNWESILPSHYYKKFPPALWKLKTWPQFKDILEHSLKYSMDISDFLRFYFSKDRLRIVAEEDGVTETKTEPVKHAHKSTIFRIRNPSDYILLARYRPDIPHFVSLLLQPVRCPRVYLGRAFTDYFFPTDHFFHDLAVYPHNYRNGILHIHRESDEDGGQEDVRTIRVFHLMEDGRILPQSSADYAKGIRYIETDRRPDRKKVEEFLLKSQLCYLARRDLNFLRTKIRRDISIFLNLLYTDKMQTDKIASQLEHAVFLESILLKDYLSKIFMIIVQIHPRYEMCSCFPEIHERWNLFFYRLDVVMPDVDVWFPRLHLFDEQQKDAFNRWLASNTANYRAELVLLLIKTNYDFLRVKIPLVSCASRVPDVCILATTDQKLSTLIFHRGQWLDLSRLGQALLDQDELVGVDDSFIKSIDHHFQTDRIAKGSSAVLLDTDYKIPDHEDTLSKNDFVLPIIHLSEETDNLPEFRIHALAYLDRLEEEESLM